MIRREILSEFPGFRIFFDRLGWEDMDFILRIAEKYKVKNLPDVLYEYRYVRSSASRSNAEANYLKLYSEEIGLFLANQRRRNGGKDGRHRGVRIPG